MGYATILIGGVLCVGLSQQTFGQDVSYRDQETFEVKLNYSFVSRVAQPKAYDIADQPKSGSFPYVKFEVTITEVLPQEHKVKVINNRGEIKISKKVKKGLKLTIDAGFVDEMKKKLIPNEYHVLFYSAERKLIHKIRIEVKEEGTYLVNDIQRGLF